MGKKKRKRPKAVDLLCEWVGCTDQQHFNVDAFAEHLNGHINDVIAAHETKCSGLVCSWLGCTEKSFESPDELTVHISYHGFHTKLMSYGLMEIRTLSQNLGKEITCGIDGSTRTLLPTLPAMFVCIWNDCEETFTRAEDFYRHVEQHPFERNNSNKQTADADSNEGSNQGSVDGPIESHFQDQVNFEPVASSSNAEEATSYYIKEPIRCLWTDCNFYSDTNTHVVQHLRSHTQEKVIACPYCGGMFSNKDKFRDHLLRQIDEDEEQVSEATIINEIEINDQKILIIAPNTRPSTSAYKCEYCDKSFHSNSLFREHNRRHYHYSQCDICGQTTDSPSSLKHHMAYRHSEDRPFACQFCTTKCKTRSDLRRHLETHSKNNPFKCSLCKFECRCCHTLAKHMKRAHLSTVSEYLCHECGKKFTRGNNLTRHLLTIHGYTLKPGQSRFTYARDSDGVYTLDQS